MLPTGFSPGYTSPSLLNRRERQQQQQRPSLPAEVLFGARVQKVSAQDDAVKKHLAKEAKEKLAEKETESKIRKDQLQARKPGIQNAIQRLTLAIDEVERELAIRNDLSEADRTDRNEQRTAYETERKDWQKQLANLTAAADKAEREYQAAQRKADELGQVHGQTNEEVEKAKQEKEKAAKAKREEEALKKSGVVVNNYLSGDAGKKTEGATEVKSATDAAKTDSKADSKVGGKSPRADFITQRVEDESNRIASDLDYYFGHENLKTNSTLQTIEGGIGRIPLIGSRITGSLTNNIARASRLKNNPTSAVVSEVAKNIPGGYGDKLLKLKLKPGKKVAPEVESAAQAIRKQLEEALEKRAGIYADMKKTRLKTGDETQEFNPTDCHKQGVKAKDYADVVLHNAAIDIAREALDYPEDKAKHAEYQKRRSEKLEAQYITSQMKWGLGVAAVGGAYMMGVPGVASVIALPFRVASFLPVPGLRQLAGWTADVIKANNTGVAGKFLGAPIRLLTAGGTTLMGGTILSEGAWTWTQKLLNVKELSQVPGAVTNLIDKWVEEKIPGAHILAKGTRTTTRVAKSIAGKLWNSPETIQNTAKSVDGKLANKPSQLAKKAQDTFSSWIGGSSEKAAAKKAEDKAEALAAQNTGTKSNAVKAEGVKPTAEDKAKNALNAQPPLPQPSTPPSSVNSTKPPVVPQPKLATPKPASNAWGVTPVVEFFSGILKNLQNMLQGLLEAFGLAGKKA